MCQAAEAAAAVPLADNPFPSPTPAEQMELAANFDNQPAVFRKWYRKYGPIVQFNVRGIDFILISDPATFDAGAKAIITKTAEVVRQKERQHCPVATSTHKVGTHPRS